MGKNRLGEAAKSPCMSLNRQLSKTKSPIKSTSSANVKVVVRVRPPNLKEQDDNHRTALKIVNDHMVIFDPKDISQAFFYHGVQQKARDLLRKPNKNIQFIFDKVFGYESTNNEIFESTTKNLIQNLMGGYNCSVFAYGATGAGKTHTMLGNNNNPGITYLTMTELFKAQEELSEERSFELGITYLEVYNENVQDLLNPGSPLQLREDARYGVTVAGLKVYKIDDPERLFSLLEKGNGNRTQHPTDSNAESSRSHAVFQVYIQMTMKMSREVRTAKLSMIDLAGSERGSATGCAGARFTEGANINKSLLALGNCINSLADGQKHVPYRDSKLTRLLKDSLGGNCQTVMVANVSPSSASYEDTYNTLKYAVRATKIKSHMKKNVVKLQLHAAEYQRINEDLKNEIKKLKLQIRTLENGQTGQQRERDEDVEQLMKICDERKKLLERIYHMDTTVSMVNLRRQFKEEADARLSGTCSDTPEKDDLRRRFTSTKERFIRQEDALQAELIEMKKQKVELETKMAEMVRTCPELKAKADLEHMILSSLESQYKAEVEKRKVSLLEEELKSKDEQLDSTWRMLQSCYLQLKGHGFANDDLVRQYQMISNHFHGFKNITWGLDLVDSGLSSTTSLRSAVEVRPVKRKLNDENNLENTFVVEPPKPKTKVCAEQLMSKVYKTPPLKKSAKENASRVGRDVHMRPKPTLAGQKRLLSVKPGAPVNKRPFRS